MPDLLPPHDIRHDPSATGRDRFSCYAKRLGCDYSAIVRQPYMTDADWHRAVVFWLKEHCNG